MKAVASAVVAGCLALAALPALAADAGKRPVLVELFTSQGCSSCPPADALAGRMAQLDDIVVLSFHVNYWDYIGWQDPFATDATTGRQFQYAETLHNANVYTPQMVIGGRLDAVGSNRASVEAAIANVRENMAAAPAIDLRMEGETLFVAIGAAPADGPKDVLLARYDRRHDTEVRRGENRGHTLSNYNVVRALERIGSWSGDAAEFSLDLPGAGNGRDGCAVIVQTPGTGPVLAAAKLEMTPAAR